MTTHNEQTLRPVEAVVEENSWREIEGIPYLHTSELKTILTIDRDAAYTMLRSIIEDLNANVPPSNFEEDNFDAGKHEAFYEALNSLDTIYGKTHTV